MAYFIKLGNCRVDLDRVVQYQVNTRKERGNNSLERVTVATIILTFDRGPESNIYLGEDWKGSVTTVDEYFGLEASDE